MLVTSRRIALYPAPSLKLAATTEYGPQESSRPDA